MTHNSAKLWVICMSGVENSADAAGITHARRNQSRTGLGRRTCYFSMAYRVSRTRRKRHVQNLPIFIFVKMHELLGRNPSLTQRSFLRFRDTSKIMLQCLQRTIRFIALSL